MRRNKSVGLFPRRPQRSLRTILIFWFLFLSIAPLAFVTGFSVVKYERAIDRELGQRLAGNGREVTTIFDDFQSHMENHLSRFVKDPGFIYYVSTEEVSELRKLLRTFLTSDVSTSMSVFNPDGKMLSSVYKTNTGIVKDFELLEKSNLYLSSQNLNNLRTLPEYAFVDFANNKKAAFVRFSRLSNSTGKVAGYIEQVIDVNPDFFESLKSRMKLEFVMFKPDGEVAVSTNSDFYLYKKDFFAGLIKNPSAQFSEISLRGAPFGFLIYPMKWGHADFYLGLGASKAEAKEALRNVNYAFYVVVGILVIGLVILTFFASNIFLKPLTDLVTAIETMQSSDRPVEMPIKSDTEIGLLAESFNDMSRHIVQAREDLKKKIVELESANKNLIETQAQLVQNSKMISLGQLVAGVAHELNNPIGFIFSNMSHLKDYSEKLIDMIETAEKSPADLFQKKKSYDLAYIKKDLPKLIASCQDGAKRTRDIVLGLRNFSRLEGTKLKNSNIHEMIDSTLALISGEIKNRIQIHKDYGEVPLVFCYEGQLNQVFMNILTNAVQAIDGPGEIWITTASLFRENADWAQISIRDSGKGMLAEVIDKIFDPFFSTKEIGQGTGLGLSISYGIVKNHGGEIRVHSAVGSGTEFTIEIPVQNPELIQKKNSQNDLQMGPA